MTHVCQDERGKGGKSEVIRPLWAPSVDPHDPHGNWGGPERAQGILVAKAFHITTVLSFVPFGVGHVIVQHTQLLTWHDSQSCTKTVAQVPLTMQKILPFLYTTSLCMHSSTSTSRGKKV